jgi:penicillin amidase
MIEDKDKLAREDMATMQADSLSLRAVEGVPGLLRTLEAVQDADVKGAADHLRAWDCRMEPESVGAAIFETFFRNWGAEVAAQRFEGDVVELLGAAVSGLALELLDDDRHSWFTNGSRDEAIARAMRRTLDGLQARLGPDMAGWTWGSVHTIQLRHHLSDRGEAFQSLDRGGDPVRGSGVTVCNTGFDPNYLAVMGANYRINADLGDSPPGLWAVDAAGQSGHPGSANYCDQLPTWLDGRHHYIPIDRSRVETEASNKLVLTGPGS